MTNNILTRLNTVINFIVARSTYSHTVRNYISKFLVCTPRLNVVAYSLGSNKVFVTYLTCIVISSKYFISEVIVSLATSFGPLNACIIIVFAAHSIVTKLGAVCSIRTSLRTILSLLNDTGHRCKSNFTELTSFICGVTTHQYKFNKGYI